MQNRANLQKNGESCSLCMRVKITTPSECDHQSRAGFQADQMGSSSGRRIWRTGPQIIWHQLENLFLNFNRIIKSFNFQTGNRIESINQTCGNEFHIFQCCAQTVITPHQIKNAKVHGISFLLKRRFRLPAKSATLLTTKS